MSGSGSSNLCWPCLHSWPYRVCCWHFGWHLKEFGQVDISPGFKPTSSNAHDVRITWPSTETSKSPLSLPAASLEVTPETSRGSPSRRTRRTRRSCCRGLEGRGRSRGRGGRPSRWPASARGRRATPQAPWSTPCTSTWGGGWDTAVMQRCSSPGRAEHFLFYQLSMGPLASNGHFHTWASNQTIGGVSFSPVRRGVSFGESGVRVKFGS